MLKIMKPFAAGAALLAGAVLPAAGADVYYEPPVVEYEPQQVTYKDEPFGGWYIRGDVGYNFNRFRGAEYYTYGTGRPVRNGSFDTAALKGALSLGAGVGYQINRYLRADVTGDYWFKSDFRGSTSGGCGPGWAIPCTSTDTSSFSALVLLANAYAELGTYKRITPYVGAGIGGAHVKWGELRNQIPGWGIDDRHRGVSEWRFAFALMAGASYCITNNLHADLGYRFTRISGGKMFEYADSSGGGVGAGPGYHRALNTHQVRAGLRYQFGGSGKDDCGEKQYVYKDPEPYTPPAVFK